ncbi:FecCD family ABC transporter permease [Paenibacillus mucilaginosus]|uniref:Iron ABC transporter permease n=2 Tax=Paenibacillus mucilaginosus TaxID=61624 RepID=I0BGB2_9BACL|nr:iron ABC transporter permease [Paenibacillus mucilaginosus]AEI40609.1 transport system permease protein [Paenibacillus mucilaginosus KNP414]AFH61409.1 iron ABC transporter permease [Paenibacillus mucilaginosus K02]MCG7216261.1 iron ABC transporter permease [Paenibacillus mucilaginosus]WDM29757.1 iron ABC transporter permease [Paenibacillus mucilaginosus]
MAHLQAAPDRNHRTARAAAVITGLCVLILLAFIISMNTGVIRLAPADVARTLFGGGTDQQKLILFDFRLPRIVISLLVGAGFAVSGAILQGVSRNALADPGLLGINAGAGLAVVLYISFFPVKEEAPVFFMPLLALLGAGTAAALVYLLAYKKEQGISSTRLILIGIAVAAGMGALMLVLTIRLDPKNYQFIAVWLAGSIWGTSWKYVTAVLPWMLVLLPLVFYKARVLDVLHLGEQVAAGLGVAIERERRRLLAAAVVLAGVCVAVGGGIGFVGLIGPHLARLLVGPKHRYLLPASALTGALMLLVADTLGRWILQPTEVPTGIVVAVIGAPYFLYLLSRSKA